MTDKELQEMKETMEQIQRTLEAMRKMAKEPDGVEKLKDIFGMKK